MYFAARTLDDLMNRVLQKLLVSRTRVRSSKGENVEIPGVLLKLANPLARLSRTENRSVLPSCLGEFLWYISGRNDLAFIEYFISAYSKYSEPDGTIWGAYGPRLAAWHGQNQLENVIADMTAHSETRQAVIQIFDAVDIAEQHKDTPCTCVMQFLARGGRLNLMVTMRSNDVYLGLPHDIFAFTMVQEIVARRLNLKLGWYKHAVGSMHLYENDRAKAERYVNEGWQPTVGVSMPPMPKGDPRTQIAALLTVEAHLRKNTENEAATAMATLNPYWHDLALILKAHALRKRGASSREIKQSAADLSASVFATYVDGIARLASSGKKAESA